MNLKVDEIYECPFCERLSRYRIHPRSATRAFFWTITWSLAFGAALSTEDVIFALLFLVLLSVAVTMVPFFFGRLRPRFHTLGAAYVPGSRRYRFELVLGPVAAGLFLLLVAMLAYQAGNEGGSGVLLKIQSYAVSALAGGVGLLSLLNGLVSVFLFRARQRRRRNAEIREPSGSVSL